MTLSHPIILFDGVCNLCNRSVQFILKRDRRKEFLFASMQGETGQRILEKHRLDANDFNSFILVDGDKIYTRSTGVLRVLKKIGGFWSVFYVFIILPKPIRDVVYNIIARNRYQWFGKREACWVPTPELKERFLN